MTGAREISGQIDYDTRAMKAPRIRQSAARLATALGLRATQLGQRMLFATATG